MVVAMLALGVVLLGWVGLVSPAMGGIAAPLAFVACVVIALGAPPRPVPNGTRSSRTIRREPKTRNAATSASGSATPPS
jgi:hypothetical protein